MWSGSLTQNFLDDDDKQKLPNLVSSIPFMQDDVKHVSYHIESLLQIFRWQKQATTILNKSVFKKIDDDLLGIDFQKIIGKTYYRMKF